MGEEPYLVSIQKRGILAKVKKREGCNHMNTLEYFEDYNLSVTQRLFKRAVSGWKLALRKDSLMSMALRDDFLDAISFLKRDNYGR